MNLNEIPKVVVDTLDGVRKYIVAKVTDGKGKERLVFRSHVNCERHIDVLKLLIKEIEPHGFGVSCIGGGFLNCRFSQKTIFLAGMSIQFGMDPNRGHTVEMLRNALPNFYIEGQ